MRKQGLSIYEIATRVKIDERRVSRFLQEAGLHRRRDGKGPGSNF